MLNGIRDGPQPLAGTDTRNHGTKNGRELDMAAYLIVDNEITDQALFDEYAGGIVAVTEAHGGRYLVRGGATEVVEGDRTPHRVVIIEFEDPDGAHGFVNDPEYARLADIRSRSSITTTIIVQGV